MANRFTFPRETALDSVGASISGAKLNFYEAGTTTRLATYSDNALTIANANPVVADSAGRFGDIFLQASDYKVVLTDASDVTIWTADPVSGTVIVVGDDYAPSQQSTPDMTVLLSSGSLFNVVSKAIVTNAAQTSGVITAPTTNPRWDIVYIDRLTGVVGITTGAEAASPSDPTIANDKLPVARVKLATTTTEITDSLITDIRELNLLGASDVVRYATGADASEIGLNNQDWAALASAATVNIGAAASRNVNITGTTTITAFDTVAAGLERDVRFDGALTLTHNATTLILPGAANIITAAGDVARFISEGSGNWRCKYYVVGSAFPGRRTVGTAFTSTSGSSHDFTGIPSWARRVTLLFQGVSLSVTDEIELLLGDAGGFETTGYVGAVSATPAGTAVGFSTEFTLVASGVAADTYSGRVELVSADGLTWMINGALGHGGNAVDLSGGYKTLSAILTQIRIQSSGTDTFDAGVVTPIYEG